MILSRWKYFVLVLGLPFACDSTALDPLTSDVYVLESVDGSPPPRVIHSNEGYSSTIVWSTLRLEEATATAVLVERVHSTFPDAPATDATETRRYAYQVEGEDVLFSYRPPCPPNALCVAPPTGKLGPSTVTLSWGDFQPLRSPALYRLAEGG